MSINQMTRVFSDSTLTPTRKLIMLVISDNANDTGVAFPSVNTIKKKTSLSTGAVINNIKWLSDNGYLFRKNRSRRSGGRTSNKYLVYPYENKDLLDEQDYLLFEDLYTQIPLDRVGREGTQIPLDDIVMEPSLINTVISPIMTEYENDFKSLWAEYSLDFLKRKGRSSSEVGTKSKALLRYLNLRKKNIAHEDIRSVVNNHAGLSFGHKHLENILSPKYFKEHSNGL